MFSLSLVKPLAVRGSVALAVTGSALFAAPSGAAYASTATPHHTPTPSATGSSASPTPTLKPSPKPDVSPFKGPLATPCPATAAAHPSPAVTDPPSAQPTTPAAGPVGGPLLGSSGVIVHAAAGVPQTPAITASSWLIADADTGEVLAAKDPHGRYLPASVLKTLTAVTLIPRLDPCAVMTATNKDVNVDGTRVGIIDKVQYRVRMLFTAMLVVSGNDAANALGTAYGGVDKTVAAMNQEARYLKAYDTTAKNDNGLDATDQKSSAYDMALIARAGLAMPDFVGYVGTHSAQFTAPHGQTFQIFTHDHLLLNYPGALGIKNGYTVAAQASYVGAATRNGHTIIATLLHSTSGTQVWHEAAALLDWGFAADGKVEPVGELVTPDLPPAPSSAAASASSAGAAVATVAGAATALPKAVAAGNTTDRKVTTASSSLALPLAAAVLLVVAATVVLTTLQRRRRRVARAQLPT